MKTMRNLLKENIEKSLSETKLGLTEHQAHIVATMVADMARSEIIKNAEEHVKMKQELIEEYETNRKQFRDFIEALQKSSKVILPQLMHQGMVHFETHPKTKKKVLKARSNVLTGVVNFLNEIDELCMQFYEEVYKYEEDGKTQLSIFPNDVNMPDEKKRQ